MRTRRWGWLLVAGSSATGCLVSFEDYPEYADLPGAGGDASGPGGAQSPDGGDDDPTQGGNASGGRGGGNTGGDGAGGSAKGGSQGQGGSGPKGGAENSGGTTANGGGSGKGGSPPTGGGPTGGNQPTGGGKATGGNPPSGGGPSGGAPSGGSPSGGAPSGGTNATGGSETGGAGSCAPGDFRGSCAQSTLEYCVDGGQWVPSDQCAGCGVLSCGLPCCANMGGFVIEPPDFTQRPELVAALYKTSVPVDAQFDFETAGQIGGVTFTLTEAQSISFLYVDLAGSYGVNDVALEDLNGVSGCTHSIDSIDGWVDLSVGECWGDSVFPVMQITPRVTSVDGYTDYLSVYAIAINTDPGGVQ